MTTSKTWPEPSASSRASEPAAIELQSVAKSYDGLAALAPVTLRVRRGERVAILGPSGAGKTTLLAMVAGELQPSSGALRLDGRDLGGLRPGRELARRVGLIHQQFDLVPNLSALHNVLVGRIGEWGLVRSLVSLVWPQERPIAMAALARVGIAERAPVRAGRLSGGEQQRVAIARLLVQDPAIMLADEPVASLDPARAEDLLRFLSDIAGAGGKTLIASLHAVDLVRSHFSRVIGLRNGELQFDVAVGDVTEEMLGRLYDLKGLESEVQATAD